MQQSRTFNAIINSIIGIFSSIITIVLNFAVRIVLVREMGDEINGLHNLFQSIVSVMSLLEMGFTTAVIILLYRPIKIGDKNRITLIMAFYKRVFQYIAGLFTLLCVIVNLFFLDDLVTSSINISVVRCYFALFSLTFIINYLTYYKRGILYAEQKNRISVGVNAVCEVLFRLFQIFSIIYLHNYYIFLLLMISEKLISNLICNSYVDKHHPYLNNQKGIVIPKEIRIAVISKVKPLFVNQIATSIHQSSKNIFIALLLGNISIVGIFGNYQLIVSTAQLLFSQFGGAFTSGFGNLAVDNDRVRMYHIYRTTTLLLDSIAIVFVSLFLSCIQPFIGIAFGSDFILDISSVFILGLEMLFYLFSIPIISIQNAMGLHDKDKNYMVLQTIFAIIFGYSCGLIWGMNGILLGILLPFIYVTYLHKGMIVSQIAFEKSKFDFLKLSLIEILKTVICVAICFVVVSLYSFDNLFLQLIFNFFNSLVLSVACLFVLSKNSGYFSEVCILVVNIFKRYRK